MGGAPDDSELLERFAASRDEAAFAELARRHLNLVYSSAARRVGDRHLAEDVTQAVFVILATKPMAARKSVTLSAWLLATVRYAAANALRIERRRRRHESAAAAASAAASSGAGGAAACSPNPSDVLIWQEVACQLDDAVLALSAGDRRAVLLRYFEQKPVADVAAALRVNESAAKQRLSRALDKLRRRLNRRGAALAPAGAGGLTTLLAAHAVSAAPPGLLGAACAAVGETAAATVAATTIAKGAMTMMAWTKVKVAAAVVAVASVVGTGAVVGVNRGLARAQDGQPVAAGEGARGGAADVRAKAEARVKAAEKVLEALAQRLEAGEALTPSFVELKAAAHRRLADAQMDVANDPAARLRIAEQYVQDVRGLCTVLERRFEAGVDVSKVQMFQCQYQLADAEYLLAKLRAAG